MMTKEEKRVKWKRRFKKLGITTASLAALLTIGHFTGCNKKTSRYATDKAYDVIEWKYPQITAKDLLRDSSNLEKGLFSLYTNFTEFDIQGKKIVIKQVYHIDPNKLVDDRYSFKTDIQGLEDIKRLSRKKVLDKVKKNT